MALKVISHGMLVQLYSNLCSFHWKQHTLLCVYLKEMFWTFLEQEMNIFVFDKYKVTSSLFRSYGKKIVVLIWATKLYELYELIWPCLYLFIFFKFTCYSLEEPSDLSWKATGKPHSPPSVTRATSSAGAGGSKIISLHSERCVHVIERERLFFVFFPWYSVLLFCPIAIFQWFICIQWSLIRVL